MSTIYKCDRCGLEMSKTHRQIRDILMAVDYDLCDECFKDFKSFMFGPERDLDSKTTLRPWSEVGAPPKINGYPLSANDESDSDEAKESPKIEWDCDYCKYRDYSLDEEPCCNCKPSVFANGEKKNNFEPNEDEEDSRYSTDADTVLSKAKYKIGSYIQSDIIKGSIYKIMGIRLRDDGEFVYKIENSSSGIQNLLWERVIDKFYTVIVKYSCDGCKLEGTDDRMCDTCIVGDPKGPRRQWWKPKEEE